MNQVARSGTSTTSLASAAPAGTPAAWSEGVVGKASRTAVDLRAVLFSVLDGALNVALLVEGGSRLPRGAPRPHQALDQEARRIVRVETGLREQYLEQLYTLGFDTDDGWTIVVSYLGLVLSPGTAPPIAGGSWTPIDRLAGLGEADRMVVDYALVRLRAKLGYTTIAFHLLPPTFTLRELQSAYEAVLGRTLDKRNFRRRVLAAGFLAETGALRRDGSHRPAHVYRFKAAHDPEAYLTPPWAQTTRVRSGGAQE